MDRQQAMQLAATVTAITGIKELVVNPVVRWLHRMGVLKGPARPPFFSLLVRWRNIGIFLAFFVIWVGGIELLLHALGA